MKLYGALISRLTDASVAIKVVKVSSNRSNHPGTGMDTRQQGRLCCVSTGRVLISVTAGQVTVSLFLSRT